MLFTAAEKPPGPRPLRSKDHIEGLPRSQLTESYRIRDEAAQGGQHPGEDTAAADQNKVKNPWGIENPMHPEDFDQCRTGLATTKPTRLLIKRIKLDALKNLRCDHAKKQFTRPDGTTCTSAHLAGQRAIVKLRACGKE